MTGDHDRQQDSWSHLGPMANRGGAGYPDLLTQVRRLQDAVVGASAPNETIVAVARHLSEIASELEQYEVPEAQAPVGTRTDLPGRGHPFLVPHVVDSWTDSRVEAHVTFTRFYLGGNGAAHGGALPLLFDEVLGRLSSGGGRKVARTAYLHVNYRHITPIGRRLELEATFDREEGRKRYISARLRDGDVVVADADGLFVELRPGQP
ncbi:hotdog domain-containing protein [Gordonia insulae]|uniref:Acyl-coenzyme A thioesterase THEM4 n=1 Tax=Gordonia insulae TaxID=2420509 RepID=A0A3G8JK59_9ACTN|nr:hotdog domain-containing protein [Gordonia insulae]AZG45471.1 hypothetical protein D7316_02067 [Gordonia insulae]